MSLQKALEGESSLNNFDSGEDKIRLMEWQSSSISSHKSIIVICVVREEIKETG